VGPGFQIALFAAVVVVFGVMGAVFWAIGRRELESQREAAVARRRTAVADAVAVFELAAAADRVALEARRREVEPAVPQPVAAEPAAVPDGAD
jgi:hypothetical protein